MTQKALQSARASQSELAQLRLEASQRQGSVEEAATLRAEKQQLEEELKSTRTQMDEMSKTLQQWKQKLSSLLAD
jgi:DNA gyrase/topoisomerase IV subunit A